VVTVFEYYVVSSQILVFDRLYLRSRLRKYILDKEDLSNYRPNSYLSFLSKFTECLVKNRRTQHLYSSNLINKFQSA